MSPPARIPLRSMETDTMQPLRAGLLADPGIPAVQLVVEIERIILGTDIRPLRSRPPYRRCAQMYQNTPLVAAFSLIDQLITGRFG